MKKWFFKACIFCVMFMMQYSKVSAAEMSDLPYIVVDGYELTKEKVIPGEDFTLTLKLRNSSKTMVANDVVINVTNPSGVLPVYGKVSQSLIDSIAPGKSVEVSFDYTSMTELVGDYLDFYVSASGTTYTNVVLRVPLGVDSPFTILASGIPTNMYVDEIAATYVSFKVLGEENVRNVYLELQVDGEGISKSSIGTLTPGVTRTQSLSPMLNTPGIYEAKLVLYYDDETTQTQSVEVESAVINVQKRVDESTENNNTPIEIPDTNQQEDTMLDKGILLGVGGIVVLLMLTAVVWVVRKRR